MFTPSSPRSSGLVIALCIAFAAAGPLVGQTTEAHYPLLTDFVDATGNYGPAYSNGATPVVPSPNGVCHNGNPAFFGGQELITPFIWSLNVNDFQVEVEFNASSFQPVPPNALANPVIIGGATWRWLGILTHPDGRVGVKYNNSNYVWSSTTATLGVWHSATLRYDAGTAQLSLDGEVILEVVTGPLNMGNNLNFSTNDTSNVVAPVGCIRNLVISNDTTLVPDDYQMNSATASVVVDGLSGSGPFGPIKVDAAIGATVFVDLTSTNTGQPWDMAGTRAPSVPGLSGGFATGGGQYVNIDFTDPSFDTFYGFAFANSFFDRVGLPVTAGTPGTVAGQLLVVDPAHVDGAALSHTAELRFQ